MKIPWTYEIDEKDLIVRNITATCFGGKYDSGDNGQTESGIKNDGSNCLLQVALPIRSTESATACSPLAFKGSHIPWRTPVKVWRESDGEMTAITAILTDNGPDVSHYPNHAIDLNPPLALKFAHEFDPKKIANEWSESGISYRIIGGAKYIS